MSFTRVNPGGWSVGDSLTSVQQNTLDIDHSHALDKTSAGDTLAGVVTTTGAGQLVAATVGGITASTAGGIKPGVGQGIKCDVAGGCQSTVAGGIVSETAGGIASNAASGILPLVAGGITAGGIAGGIKSDAVGGIQLAGGSTDFPTFSPSRSKSYSFPLQPLDPTVVSTSFSGNVCQADGSGGLLTGAQNKEIVLALPNPHQGATLAAVHIWFFVGQVHPSVPGTFPAISVFRRQITNGGSSPAAIQYLSATNFQFASAASGSAWYAGGVVQSLDYATDQNQVIDNVNYTYFVSFIDEHGTNSLNGNDYIGVTAAYSAIPDMKFAC